MRRRDKGKDEKDEKNENWWEDKKYDNFDEIKDEDEDKEKEDIHNKNEQEDKEED